MESSQKQQQRSVANSRLDLAIRSGIAGGLAGCAAKTLVAPLDRIKILFQASNPNFVKYTSSPLSGLFLAARDIVNLGGWTSLYQGHSATLLRIFPYAGFKFIAYEQFKAILVYPGSPAYSVLLAGSLAGLTSVMITYPLELIRVRMAFQVQVKQHPFLSTVRETWQGTFIQEQNSRGLLRIRHFYKGFMPTMLGMIPYAGVSFAAHDSVGNFLSQYPQFRSDSTLETNKKGTEPSNIVKSEKKKKRLKTVPELVAGGLAGIVSQTSAYPLEVIRRRVQTSKLTMREAASTIWKERGFRGFWVGITIGYLKVAPMVGCSFLVYERSKEFLGI